MSKIIRLMDRTRTVTDWKCPRARYWGYEHEGRGVVKAGSGLALEEGIAIHDALSEVAFLQLNDEKIDIDTIAPKAGKAVFDSIVDNKGKDIVDQESEEFANEQANLVEGLVRGFYKYMWPRLMAMYPKIICVEQEMEYPLYQDEDIDYVFMTKPDLIVETKEGELVYIEYKSTSSKKEEWVTSWDTAVQLHSSAKATERSLGKLPIAVQIVGLYKGYFSYGKQSSPFCYGYKKSGNPPFTQDSIVYDYKAGYKRFPTWEIRGGIKDWVNSMPDEILANQFPLTPQIFINEDLIKSFFDQRLLREREIQCSNFRMNDEGKQAIMDEVFPQRWDQCQPSFGWACQYKKLCHGFVEDPLTEGFVLREPHHDAERIQLGLEPREDGR